MIKVTEWPSDKGQNKQNDYRGKGEKEQKWTIVKYRRLNWGSLYGSDKVRRVARVPEGKCDKGVNYISDKIKVKCDKITYMTQDKSDIIDGIDKRDKRLKKQNGKG